MTLCSKPSSGLHVSLKARPSLLWPTRWLWMWVCLYSCSPSPHSDSNMTFLLPLHMLCKTSLRSLYLHIPQMSQRSLPSFQANLYNSPLYQKLPVPFSALFFLHNTSSPYRLCASLLKTSNSVSFHWLWALQRQRLLHIFCLFLLLSLQCWLVSGTW